MFASWRVGIVFTAANLTGHAFSTIASQARNAERAVDGSAAALSRLRTIGTAAFATVGVLGVATFTKAADAAGKYQLQMSLLQQQLGATDGQMEAIGKRIISLSSGPTRTMFGMGELAVMARGIQQSGLGAGAVENLLTPIAYAAEIEKLRHGGHLDTAQFTANVSATIKGLGLGAPGREKDAMSFADLFTRYASISKLNSAGLLAYENQFGLISREAGWKGEDFLAAGAYLSQMGVKPQMIGTMMKNIVTNLNPRANLTGHAANAQFSGLAMLGMLKPSDPGMARKYLSLVESSQKNLGLEGVDPSKMTAKQQDTLGQAVLRASVTSKAWGGGLAGVVTLLSTAQDSFAKEFGADKANAMMITLARNVFNLRGLPPALAMAQGGMKSLNDLKAQALLQVPLDARAAALRGEYEPMKEMFGQMINSVMITLGGVTAGGKVTKGGPLDIATKVLQQIETFIGLMTAWSANNPKLIAQIGTLIGVLGVAGLAAAALAAAGAVVGMVSNLAILAPMFGAVAGVILAPLGIIAALGLGVTAILYFSKHSSDLQHYISKAGAWIAVEGGKLLSDALHNLIKGGIAGFLKNLTPDSKSTVQKTLLAHPAYKSGSWNPFDTRPVPGGAIDLYRKMQVSNAVTDAVHVPYSREWTKKHMPVSEERTSGNQTFKIDVNVHGLSTPEVVKKIEDAIKNGVLAAARRGSGFPSTMGLLLGAHS